MKKLIFSVLCFVFITSFAFGNDEQIYEETKLNFNSQKPIACSTPETIINIVDKKFYTLGHLEISPVGYLPDQLLNWSEQITSNSTCIFSATAHTGVSCS